MSYYQRLAALAVGESCEFETLRKAKSAGASACRFYNGMRFQRVGLTIVRIT